MRWEWGGTRWGLSWGSSLTPLLPITNMSGHEKACFLRKQDKLKGCRKVSGKGIGTQLNPDPGPVSVLIPSPALVQRPQLYSSSAFWPSWPTLSREGGPNYSIPAALSFSISRLLTLLSFLFFQLGTYPSHLFLGPCPSHSTLRALTGLSMTAFSVKHGAKFCRE